MKSMMYLSISLMAFFAIGCKKSGTEKPAPGSPNNTIEKGIIKGRITTENGNPLSGLQVVVENTVYYASYVYATSDANGYYKANVPTGSWQASVLLIKNYHGKDYAFDLHPENADPFAGTDGAIRNFTFKLKGVKPQGGFYGSSVAVYPEPGSILQMDDVELTLTPDGPLADGNAGQSITSSLSDIGGGEDGILDVPLGKYSITARKKTSGEPLLIRLRNSGSYNPSVIGIFKSGYTSSTNYQIVVQVK